LQISLIFRFMHREYQFGTADALARSILMRRLGNRKKQSAPVSEAVAAIPWSIFNEDVGGVPM
jgi:hypothetical protein